MKPINLSDDYKNKVLADFKRYLDSNKTLDTALTYRFQMESLLGKEVCIPVIYWSPQAWVKMQTLVHSTKEEIAWHGLMRKIEGQEDTYLVYDILVYPQRVDAASAYTDQEAYTKWITELPDDSFHSLRMQGHSHVNMSVSPSATDTNLYDSMLATLARIPFYLFLITNKSGDMYMLFYDFEQNIIFETKELISEVLLEDDLPLTDWHKQVSKMVTRTEYTAISSHTPGASSATTGHVNQTTGARAAGFTPSERERYEREDDLMNYRHDRDSGWIDRFRRVL